jgi:hypothetical protein
MRPAISLAIALAMTAGSPGIAAADGDEGVSTNTVRAKANHPPKPAIGLKVDPAIADFSAGMETPLRSGRPTRITFQAEDPDDDRLVYSVDPLPAGATFDKDQGVLTWNPVRAQEGKHQISFAVTDGELSAQRTFLIVVRPNRAPQDSGEATIFRRAKAIVSSTDANEGGEAGRTLLANDRDSDEVSFEIRQQPAGARVIASSGSVYFVWQPAESDVGEHDLVLDVSDGERRTTVSRKVVVIPEWAKKDYHRWLLLGGGASAFVTHGDGEFFVGGAFDVTLVAIREDGVSGYACAHGVGNYECHASHHRFYGQFEVLDSTRSGAPALFAYGIGFSASLEWYPARRYLIPHYGVEVGGLVRSEVAHRAQVRPYLGLHLWADEDVWINATFGYRIVPAELRDLSGPSFALSAVMNPW